MQRWRYTTLTDMAILGDQRTHSLELLVPPKRLDKFPDTICMSTRIQGSPDALVSKGVPDSFDELERVNELVIDQSQAAARQNPRAESSQSAIAIKQIVAA